MLTLFNLGGAPATPAGAGFAGPLDLPFDPILAHLFGTIFDGAMRDQTGNRHVVNTIGAPSRQPLYAFTQSYGSVYDCFEADITGDAAVAASGGCTFVSVARLFKISGSYVTPAIMSTYQGSPVRHLTMADFNGNFGALHGHDGGGGDNCLFPLDAGRADRFAMYATVFSNTREGLYERHADSGRLYQLNDPHSPYTNGGLGLIRFGACGNTGIFNGALHLAFAAVFPTMLTADQLDSLYAILSAFFARSGLQL